MRSKLKNLLLPLLIAAATAVPTDPARAEVQLCPRAQPAGATKGAKPAAPATPEKKEPRRWRLEAL